MPDDTRDIAMRADTKVDAHVADCIRFRMQIADSFKEVRGDLKKQNWIIALIVGGFIAVGKFVDFLTFIHH